MFFFGTFHFLVAEVKVFAPIKSSNTFTFVTKYFYFSVFSHFLSLTLSNFGTPSEIFYV